MGEVEVEELATTPEERERWREWLELLSPEVRKVAEAYPLGTYRMPSGHFAQIYSYDENDDGSVTLSVDVTAMENPHKLILFDRRVFGVSPSTLVPVRVMKVD